MTVTDAHQSLTYRLLAERCHELGDLIGLGACVVCCLVQVEVHGLAGLGFASHDEVTCVYSSDGVLCCADLSLTVSVWSDVFQRQLTNGVDCRIAQGLHIDRRDTLIASQRVHLRQDQLTTYLVMYGFLSDLFNCAIVQDVTVVLDHLGFSLFLCQLLGLRRLDQHTDQLITRVEVKQFGRIVNRKTSTACCGHASQ